MVEIQRRNSDSRLSKRVVTSLGATIQILSFFSQKELLKMQILSKWMYEKGIGRVQWRIDMKKKIILFHPTYSNIVIISLLHDRIQSVDR